VIQDARRSGRQAHHDAGIQNTTGSRRKLLDEGDNDRDPQRQAPGHGPAFGGRPPEAHAVERRHEIVEGVVSLDRPNDQREGPLDDEGGEFFVEALVTLGVGEEDTAQCVQAPLDLGQDQGRIPIERLEGDREDPRDRLGQDVNNPEGSPYGPKDRHEP